jgi:Protein of unknown function (DUF3987)
MEDGPNHEHHPGGNAPPADKETPPLPLNGHTEPTDYSRRLAEARAFLQPIHDAAAGIDGKLVMTVVDSKTEKATIQHFRIGNVDAMAKEAVDRSEVVNCNVYMALSVLRKSLPHGARGGANDIVAVLGLPIDDDGDTTDPNKRALRPTAIEPALEVTTCTTPTTNRQPHFLFTNPVPPDRAKELADLLHRKCGGDYGTKDVVHVWRIPGTWNYPNKIKLMRGRPEAPQPVTLTGTSAKRYDPDELRRVLNAMPDRVKRSARLAQPQPAKATANGASHRIHAPERKVVLARLPGVVIDMIETEIVEGEGDRSAHAYRTMITLMEHALTDEEVRIVADGAPFAAKFVNRGDINEEIGRVRSRWEDGGSKLAPDAFLEPDMSVVRRNRVAASTFPTYVLGSAAEWVTQTAASKSAPVDYVALGLIVAAGAMVGPKRRVSPWEGWEEPSIIWGMIVGDPSLVKSPSLDPHRDAVRTLERELNANFEDRRKEFELAKKTAEEFRSKWDQEVREAVRKGATPPEMPEEAVEPKAPTRVRLWAVDQTPEKAARILGQNPEGFLLMRDELSGWLGGFDKYGGTGGDRAFWIETYGGRSYRYERVSLDEPVDIDFCAVSVLGGMQPDRLNTALLSGDDDGMAARPLYAWPDPVPPHRPKHGVDRESILRALRRLRSLTFDVDAFGNSQPRIKLLESDAADEFQAWWEQKQWNAKLAAGGRLSGAIGKLDGVTLRLAQTLELLQWAWSGSNQPEPDKVSLQSLRYALTIVDDWVRPTLERVFAEAALPQPQRDAMTVGRWLLNAKPANRLETVNARELRRLPGFPGPKEAKELDAAIDVLIDARWLLPLGTDRREAHRPRKDFRVNPRIFERP